MLAGDFEVKYHDNQALELLATSEDSKIHPSSVYFRIFFGQSMYCIEKYAEVNMQGTAIMLDILANDKSHQVKK